MTFIMTPEERESFLADPHVGVVSVAWEGRGPLSVPIWYGYQLGGNIWLTEEGRKLEKRLKTCMNQCYRCHLCERTYGLPDLDSSIQI